MINELKLMNILQLATRASYGKALVKLAKNCNRIYALDGDMKNSTFSQDYMKAYPDRFVECFIAEQNMVRIELLLNCGFNDDFCRLLLLLEWLQEIDVSHFVAHLLHFYVEHMIIFEWGLFLKLTVISLVLIVVSQSVSNRN